MSKVKKKKIQKKKWTQKIVFKKKERKTDKFRKEGRDPNFH